MVDDENPGYFSEWLIDTTPYDYPEVFHVCEEQVEVAAEDEELCDGLCPNCGGECEPNKPCAKCNEVAA